MKLEEFLKNNDKASLKIPEIVTSLRYICSHPLPNNNIDYDGDALVMMTAPSGPISHYCEQSGVSTYTRQEEAEILRREIRSLSEQLDDVISENLALREALESSTRIQ